jgi:dihydropteroate synthase
MSKPKLMAVLNITPDSFFDQGAYFALEKAVARGKECARLGADLIDIGGASYRPGSLPLSTEEELRRVLPLIEALRGTLPLSIDSYNPAVASAAVARGASLINDISGFTHPLMRELAASCTADLCVMHMQGTPETMQRAPNYPDGVVVEVMRFFEKQIELLLKEGVRQERLILDPGIGFGKSVEHNIELLKAIPKFKQRFGLRLLIGASRKSFMSKILGKNSTELLPATLVIHTMALLTGADLIRTHDINEHRDLIDLISHLQ